MDQLRYQTPPPVPLQPELSLPHKKSRAQRARNLTRSDRIRCRTLRFNGAHMSYSGIARELHFTRHQVQTACNLATTPTKPTGRPLTLSTLQIDQLIDFLSLSRPNRRMNYLQLALGPFAHWHVSELIISHALATRGYGRYVALGKPGLSEKSRRERLQFALDHLDWTIEQWSSILWSDETWVNGRHRKIWITRKKGEQYEDSCLFTRVQRRPGWMFWGCFSGHKKGPCMFWEKSWKSINSERYIKHILPEVEKYITLHPYLIYMQDNAPAHGAKLTKNWLRNHQIQFIKWPSNSPDLNPIEILWNWMKQWIQENHSTELDSFEAQGKRVPYPRLKEMVQQAWDQITEDDLKSLLYSMKDRCQAVINANGLHTKY